jgi:hypothetical protein
MEVKVVSVHAMKVRRGVQVLLIFRRFTIKLRHTTLGRTPLDE